MVVTASGDQEEDPSTQPLLVGGGGRGSLWAYAKQRVSTQRPKGGHGCPHRPAEPLMEADSSRPQHPVKGDPGPAPSVPPGPPSFLTSFLSVLGALWSLVSFGFINKIFFGADG